MDMLLFFKVGSFYELYQEDAQVARDVLDWQLTVTGVGKCFQVGCPEKSLPGAIERLNNAGTASPLMAALPAASCLCLHMASRLDAQVPA